MADIGIKETACPEGTTCEKPSKDALTKLIPSGGKRPHGAVAIYVDVDVTD